MIGVIPMFGLSKILAEELTFLEIGLVALR